MLFIVFFFTFVYFPCFRPFCFLPAKKGTWLDLQIRKDHAPLVTASHCFCFFCSLFYNRWILKRDFPFARKRDNTLRQNVMKQAHATHAYLYLRTRRNFLIIIPIFLRSWKKKKFSLSKFSPRVYSFPLFWYFLIARGSLQPTHLEFIQSKHMCYGYNYVDITLHTFTAELFDRPVETRSSYEVGIYTSNYRGCNTSSNTPSSLADNM